MIIIIIVIPFRDTHHHSTLLHIPPWCFQFATATVRYSYFHPPPQHHIIRAPLGIFNVCRDGIKE